MELQNVKCDYVLDMKHGTYHDITGMECGSSIMQLSATDTTAQFSAFAKPRTNSATDIRIQLAEESPIGTVKLMSEASTFWSWCQEYKPHSSRMYWDMEGILGVIPTTDKHHGMKVHILCNCYMLMLEDVFHTRNGLLVDLKVDPTSKDLALKITKRYIMHTALITSLDANIRADLTQNQNIILGD